MSTVRTRGSVAARLLVVLLVLLGLLGAPALASAATRYDPRLRFRTYRTEHFDVHAHQGEEALARKLGAIAERVRARFQPALGTPRGRVQVILVDQTDVANGWANPVPYNAIEIAAMPPLAEELIGNTTNWLEVAFTHEYTHILHLDRSLGVMGGVRRVFGRAPLVFPNLFLPVWQIEGFATYEESRMTGQGRVPTGDFRAIVDAPARQGRFDSIDRASGGLDDWPVGHAPYAYGAYFHQFLTDRYGAARVESLADATAARFPLLGADAFRAVMGVPLTTLWRQFQDARERSAPAPGATDAAARQLTHDGFIVGAPRVGADGAIYYRSANADRFPALVRLDGHRIERLAWRVQGVRTSIGREWIVFDQLQFVRSVALFSDLYAVPRAGGPTIRLTKDARAGHPDLSPDGRRIACVVQATGRRALAIVAFAPDGPAQTPRVLIDDPGADFTGPRWSPDGTSIVVERRRAGLFELVLVDPASGAVRTLLSRADVRVVTPSWTPDGSTVLFSADADGRAFNVFAADVHTGAVVRVTDTAFGARFPEIAPDGSLIYVGYTAAGYDLFSVPFHPSAETGSLGSSSAGSSGLRAGDDVAADEISGPKAGATYSPLHTLVPTYWSPVLLSDAGEFLAGAGTGMSDALGRHAYAVDAAWTTSRGRPDWSASYAYDRWRPTLYGSYRDDTDPIAGGEARSREFFAGALLPFRRVRWSQTLMAGFDAETQTAECPSGCRGVEPRRDLRSIRTGWLYSSRRLFGYSISTEEGVSVEMAIEASRTALGADADANAAILDVRAFHRIFSRHTVLAVRLAGASGWGTPGSRRRFSAAGSGGVESSFDFGRDTIGLLRGFDSQEVLGLHAAVLNADLRIPIARIQRGPALVPVFVRSVHAAAFVDLGHAWDSTFRAEDIRSAVGGELSSDLVIVHYFPLTVAGGASWTRDPVAGRDRAAVFARFAYAF